MTSVYIGETSMTPFDRSAEHWQALRTNSKNSPLVEHNEEVHPGQEPRFKMEVIGYPKSNLLRQQGEAEQIRRHEKLNLLSRKGEWG